MLNNINHYPRAIVHIDGDCFFAACEIIQNPELKGKPVVTGSERGIVTSLTYEAKARGIKRGMNMFEAKRACPSVVILDSDYETYNAISVRMLEIVRRFTAQVEAYSIDECFADITGMQRPLNMTYEKIAHEIQKTLNQELGITFSVGLAPTKVLAKIGSKWQKPAGFTALSSHRLPEFLNQTPVSTVWGIGLATSVLLEKYGIKTADDFASKSEDWVRSHVAKPYYEIWKELQGIQVNKVDSTTKTTYQSISKTQTFTPPSSDRAALLSQLSKNTENACIKLRRHGLGTKKLYFFLKTQSFDYKGIEIKLDKNTDLPTDLLTLIDERLDEVLNPYLSYRSTGVILMDVTPLNNKQLDLFGQSIRSERLTKLFGGMDALAEKYGKHITFLGTSLAAMVKGQSPRANSYKMMGRRELFSGENINRRLSLPFMGQVS